MKLELFFSLILMGSLSCAMQPAQLLSDATARAATKELIDLIDRMYFMRNVHSAQEAQQLYNDIETLLKKGANPNVFSITQSVMEGARVIGTPPQIIRNPPQIRIISLLDASIPHYPAITELLLKAGAQPTPIFIFVGNPREQAWKPLQRLEDLDPVLIEKINKISMDNYYLTSNSPLTDAINTDTPHRSDLVRMLLKAGAIPEYKDLHQALEKEDAGIIALLLNHLPWPPPKRTTLNENDKYYVPQIIGITNRLKYSPDPDKNEILKIFETFENPLLSAVRQANVARVRQLIAAGQENPFERKEGPSPNLSLQSPYQLAFEKYGDLKNRHLKSKYKLIIELLESDTKHKAAYLKKTRESVSRLPKEK